MPLKGTIENSKPYLLYGLVSAYLLLSVVALANEWLLFFIAPILILLVFTSLTRLDLMLLFTGLITPFSINLAKTGLGIGVSLPSEPIIFGIMLVYILKLLHDGGIDKKLLYHPISLTIMLHLIWMFITSFTSTMPVVSIKQTVARFSFVMVFFYLGSQVFKDLSKARKFIWLYIIAFTGVIAFTIFNHASAGFTEKAAHVSMVPFYNDHTAYAAAAAMYLPLLIMFTFDKGYSSVMRWSSGIVMIIFIISLILSYTRASWVSLLAALLCYLVLVFRVKTWVVITGFFSIILLYLAFQTTITMELERNDEESSSDYASHIQSASNITTDASNVERLNRWNSAFRMFAQKPVFGWGPGTYMFQYAPFQKIDEKTIISTNFGEGGNAHSEYIGPLAEQGIPGPVLFILIGVAVIMTASKFIINCIDNRQRNLVKALLLGLVTYWVHGMLNNFLDTEKASLPFWGFIAIITALDIYGSKSEKLQEKSTA